MESGSKENIINKEDNYSENKELSNKSNSDKRVLRLLTVILYLLSVSTPAILLSSYYIILWDSKGTNATTMVPQALAQIGTQYYPTDLHKGKIFKRSAMFFKTPVQQTSLKNLATKEGKQREGERKKNSQVKIKPISSTPAKDGNSYSSENKLYNIIMGHLE